MSFFFPNPDANTFIGTAQSETITGNNLDNNIDGLEGNDILNGLGGNDFIVGWSGNDTLVGGDGNDMVLGWAGNDYIDGGNGHDWLQGDGHSFSNGPTGNDIFLGGSGSDLIQRGTYTSDATIDGGTHSADPDRNGFNGDVVWYQSEDNLVDSISKSNNTFAVTTVQGYTDTLTNVEYLVFASHNNPFGYAAIIDLTSNDSYFGGLNNDLIQGSNSSNSIISGAGDDVITTGNGGNFIASGKGNDKVTSGSGDDIIYAGNGSDQINSGAGDDIIVATDTGNIIAPGAGNDVIAGGDSSIYASEGDDIIVGSNISLNYTYSAKQIKNISFVEYDYLNIDQFDKLREHLSDQNLYPFFTKPTQTQSEFITYSYKIETIFGSETIEPYSNNSISFSDITFQLPGALYDAPIDTASAGSVNIIYNPNSDTVTGTDADDLIFNHVNDARIDGGNGKDRVTLDFSSQEIINVELLENGSLLIAADQNSVTLNSIEEIAFSDGKKSNSSDFIDYYTSQSNSLTSPFIQENFNFYSGSVAFLEYESFGESTTDVIIGSSANDFINLLGGDDAANGGDGQDVLDGGSGSNFLTGGNGADTFFLDGRGGTTTWSTITDFNGDSVNIWGWIEGTSRQVFLVENAGAEGYKGATFHYDLNNDGTIDTSITFSGLSVDQLPTSSAHTIEENGYLLFS